MIKPIASISFIVSAILLVGGELLFSAPPAGGREDFYTKTAQDLRHSATESEASSIAYHKKASGIDKSDEPQNNFQWLAWHHDAEDKAESYAKLAMLDRAKAQELDNLVQNLALARAEHLHATRLGSGMGFMLALLVVSFWAFHRLWPKLPAKVSR